MSAGGGMPLRQRQLAATLQQQDTRAPPLGLPALASAGVSVAHDYDVNSLAVPRRAKEAIGAITRLTYPDGRCAAAGSCGGGEVLR